MPWPVKGQETLASSRMLLTGHPVTSKLAQGFTWLGRNSSPVLPNGPTGAANTAAQALPSSGSLTILTKSPAFLAPDTTMAQHNSTTTVLLPMPCHWLGPAHQDCRVHTPAGRQIKLFFVYACLFLTVLTVPTCQPVPHRSIFTMFNNNIYGLLAFWGYALW